jgi:hypothetical protein
VDEDAGTLAQLMEPRHALVDGNILARHADIAAADAPPPPE